MNCSLGSANIGLLPPTYLIHHYGIFFFGAVASSQLDTSLGETAGSLAYWVKGKKCSCGVFEHGDGILATLLLRSG